MTPEVEQAIAELRAAFPDNGIEVEAETQGGAYVTVHDLSLGAQFRPERAWIGFLIPYTYPYSDVYPHFALSTLARDDGEALGAGFGSATWRDRPVTQLSRRSNRWNPAEDTALLKLQKVLAWLAGR